MNPSNPKPLLHPIQEAARILGISRSSIYRLVERGTLEIVRIGGRALLRRSDLENLAASGEVSK